MQQIISGHRLFQLGHPLHLNIVDIQLNEEHQIEITASSETSADNWVCGGFCEPFAQLGDPSQLHKESFDSFAQLAKSSGYVAVGISPETKQTRDQQEQIEYILSKSKSSLTLHPYAALTIGLKNQSPSEMHQLLESGAVGFSNGNAAIDDNGLMARLLQYTSMLNSKVMYTPLLTNIAGGIDIADGNSSILTGWEGNPYIAETMAIQRDISLLEYYGGSIIWNKVSSRHSIPLIKAAKEKGLNVSATVSINNLTFNEDNHLGLDPYFKVYPTLRSKEDQTALQEALFEGIIDGVVSDHQAQDYESKELEFEYAEYGIASQEFMLPVLSNIFGTNNLSRILEILCDQNFRLLGLEPSKISPERICVVRTGISDSISPISKGINPMKITSPITSKAELVS